MQLRSLGLIVVSALVILNTAGYLLYRQVVGGKHGDATAGEADTQVAGQAAAVALPPQAAPPVATATGQGDGESTLVRGYRAAGIQALEQGDFDAALENFEEAIRLGGKSDLPVLVKIATQMRDRAAGKTGSSAPAADDEAGPEVVERRLGTLVVTSSPPNLEVTINGRIVDTTPATIDLRYGKYWIGLLRDGQEAYRRRIEVEPGAVASVNHDFTEGVELGAADPMVATPGKRMAKVDAELGISIAPLAGIESDPNAIEEAVVAPPEPKPQPSKPVTVSYRELRQYQVEGSQNISPPDIVLNQMVRSGAEKISATVMLCVSATGEVTSRKVTKGSAYAEYDSKLVDEVGHWSFKPFLRNGKPVPACSTVTFVFKTQ